MLGDTADPVGSFSGAYEVPEAGPEDMARGNSRRDEIGCGGGGVDSFKVFLRVEPKAFEFVRAGGRGVKSLSLGGVSRKSILSGLCWKSLNFGGELGGVCNSPSCSRDAVDGKPDSEVVDEMVADMVLSPLTL